MIILGIDPGTVRMGYAIIECLNNQPTKVLSIGYIDLSDISEHPEKMKVIYEDLSELIKRFCPDEMAIESPFYGKNVQSMLKLGRAQGVAMAAGFVHHLSVTEYPPKTVKLSITGNGNASKEQVAAVLKSIVSFQYTEKYNDATDALSVAVCHCFHTQNPVKLSSTKKNTSKGKTWKSFIEKNPHRKI
ncbi:MAG: crossover junction endodeoxyribonuclease RuvC [Bacteroidia bacterium]|nr:crossover junction endodeoxyribonuclease RuvC [Bacteroidia bacterium]